MILISSQIMRMIVFIILRKIHHILAGFVYLNSLFNSNEPGLIVSFECCALHVMLLVDDVVPGSDGH